MKLVHGRRAAVFFARSLLPLLVVVVLQQSVVVGTQCTPEAASVCGRRFLGSSRNLVIGGAEVCPSFEYSHLVAIVKGSFLSTTTSLKNCNCGGTLYGRQHVVTASHCLYDENNLDRGFDLEHLRGLAVEVHRHDLTSPLCSECGVRIAVASIAKHPDYDNGNLHNDIAVLRLAEPVPDDFDIRPVTLDRTGGYFKDGQRLVLAGWGSTSGDTKNLVYSPTLQATDLQYIPTSDCTGAGWAYQPGDITDKMFCVGYTTDSTRGQCVGDSGGPAFVACREGPIELVGIVSWSRGCALPKAPGIFTKVSAYADWVDGVVQGTMETNLANGVEVEALPEIFPYVSKRGEEACCCDTKAKTAGCSEVDCGSVDCSTWKGSGCIDCSGYHCDEYTTWIGDGGCDSGEKTLSFNCEAFNWDGWDCPHPDNADPLPQHVPVLDVVRASVTTPAQHSPALAVALGRTNDHNTILDNNHAQPQQPVTVPNVASSSLPLPRGHTISADVSDLEIALAGSAAVLVLVLLVGGSVFLARRCCSCCPPSPHRGDSRHGPSTSEERKLLTTTVSVTATAHFDTNVEDRGVFGDTSDSETESGHEHEHEHEHDWLTAPSTAIAAELEEAEVAAVL